MMNKQEIEKLILEEFRKVPFHNLYFYLQLRPLHTKYGGTCSDKVVNLYEKMSNMGIEVSLHTSYMDGEESHRLLKIRIKEQVYFADVGNSWPSIKLFPTDKAYCYTVYGRTFSSQPSENRIKIYHEKNGISKLKVEVPFYVKPEAEILHDIKVRFDKNNNDQFLHSVRFAQVVGDQFYFLRGEVLFVYSNNVSVTKIDVQGQDLADILMNYFQFDLVDFVKNSIQLKRQIQKKTSG